MWHCSVTESSCPAHSTQRHSAQLWELSPERHSCRHPWGTLLPNLASISSPPSDSICPRPESDQGGLGFCSIFPTAHGGLLSHYCITQKKGRPQLPQAAHMQDKKEKAGKGLSLQLQYWKDMEINQLAGGYTSSLWQRQELNQNPPSPVLVPLPQAFPLCLQWSVFTF